MSNFIARKVVQHFQTIQTPGDVEDLTVREKEILGCLVKGLRNKEIADARGRERRNDSRSFAQYLSQTAREFAH